MKNDPNMPEEYDFSGGVRGKYAKRYEEGTNVVVIDPDVTEYFSDHDSVNEALRSLAAIIRLFTFLCLHLFPHSRFCTTKEAYATF
jgi:hypothetical protein